MSRTTPSKSPPMFRTTPCQTPHCPGEHQVNLYTVQSTGSVSAHYRTAPSQSLHCPKQRQVNLRTVQDSDMSISALSRRAPSQSPHCPEHRVNFCTLQDSAPISALSQTAQSKSPHCPGQHRINPHIVQNSTESFSVVHILYYRGAVPV